jgi:alpha-D-ribose 1-methylphosphonate 5-triphosphate synthase subunit PhnG
MQNNRQNWLSVLARASLPEIEEILVRAPDAPSVVIIKAPEVGTVMIEGRAGGTGQRFNLGEATVTRAVVQLRDATVGVAYALGSNRAKAERAALVDALLQTLTDDHPAHAAVRSLRAAQAERAQSRSRKAAATKVDFFTMARGD